MLALKEAKIKAEAIPVHMHQGQTATKQPRDKSEKYAVFVHYGPINEPTTLCLPTEE